MGKTIEERLENLEKAHNVLATKVCQIEANMLNLVHTNQANSPYSGNAFQSPFGNPFRYTTVSPIQPVSEIPNQNEVIIQKLDKIIDLFNNNFSRLNWRLEALENQRKE